MKIFLLLVTIGCCMVRVDMQGTITLNPNYEYCNLFKCNRLKYEPVCGQIAGQSQHTYCNNCQMTIKACLDDTPIAFVKEGVCDCILDTPGGPIFLNEPACGKLPDGTTQTFVNLCEMAAVNNCQWTDYKFISFGPCPAGPV